jgi:hypothetical protein
LHDSGIVEGTGTWDLLDQLVGEDLQAPRNLQLHRARGLQVDDEVVVERLLDRNVGGLRAPQYAVDALGGAAEELLLVGGVRAEQAARGQLASGAAGDRDRQAARDGRLGDRASASRS